jgi:hypothetical protein
MSWEVLIHPEVERWIISLTRKEYEAVVATLDALSVAGPALGRPIVDHIKNSKFSNMKELRPLGTSLRILFAFDRNRNAVLLACGDKKHDWRIWYQRNIPIADSRFAAHLKEMESNNG